MNTTDIEHKTLATQLDHIEKALHHLESKTLDRPMFSTKNRHDMGFSNFIQGKDLELKALTSSHQREFLVPSEVQYRLNEEIKKVSSFRHLCQITSVRSDHLDIVLDDQMAQVGWVNETDPRLETNVSSFQKKTISLHNMYAKPKVSQQLLDDSDIDIEQWLLEKIAHHMGILENKAFLKGDGIHQPKGILSYVDKGIDVYTSKVMDPDTLITMTSDMDNSFLHGCSWVISRSALGAIRRLKDPSSGHYLFQPSLALGAPSSLLGYPVVVLDIMPDMVNDNKEPCVLFGNFKEAYTIVEKDTMPMLRDPFSSKPFVEFYITKRVGGDLIQGRAVKAMTVLGERG